MDELGLIGVESKATYAQNKEYILEKLDFKGFNMIAQINKV